MARILGIRVTQYPNTQTGNKEPFFELVIIRQIETVDADNYKKSGIGFDTEVPYKKEPIRVDPVYAEFLKQTGAFIPDREYSFEFGHNPDDPYIQWVSKLIPLDDEVKKHFQASLAGYQKKG